MCNIMKVNKYGSYIVVPASRRDVGFMRTGKRQAWTSLRFPPLKPIYARISVLHIGMDVVVAILLSIPLESRTTSATLSSLTNSSLHVFMKSSLLRRFRVLCRNLQTTWTETHKLITSSV